MATPELDGYAVAVIWAIGHRNWGVKNHAFNELTQHYHLKRWPPVSRLELGARDAILGAA